MVLRRLAVALLSIVSLTVAASPALAANYPPKAPTTQTIVAPGVVYGGSKTGATTFSMCKGQLAVDESIQQGDPFVLEVCGFLPGSTVVPSVRPPGGTDVALPGLTADSTGAVLVGPFRLTAPGVYVISLAGTSDTTAGVSGLGMAKIFGDPDRTVEFALTVPTSGSTALTRTGGDGGGHSAGQWGLGLVSAGLALLLAGGLRRRSLRSRRHRRAHA
jgi:hypothetical protein